MNYYLAEKTLTLIDQALEADQGNKYRRFLEQVVPHIGDAYREDDMPFRAHLGASGLGKECPREIWYGFRWATVPKFEGRILRLFNRGHLEEARFIALLLMIGVQVYQQDENGKQFRITGAEGHLGGSGDGILVGLPDLPPGTPALGEFKTHNDKSFNSLVSKGVKESKHEHYVQMQLYMRKMGLAHAFYFATNKNDDALHAEIVPLDIETADMYLARGEKIVWLETPPKKISETSSWWQCKFCDHKPVCHLNADPHKNCRTCRYGKPSSAKVWKCTNFESDKHGDLTVQQQFEGCKKYTRGI